MENGKTRKKTIKRGLHNKTRNKKRRGGQANRIRLDPNSVQRKKKCHPELEHSTVNDQSCLTGEEVNAVAHHYNKRNPKHPVTAKGPAEIWQQLHERLQQQCKGQERCWLKQLPEGEREKIDNKAFVPKKPPGWKKNPVAWLSNEDIEKVLQQYQKNPKNHFAFLKPASIDFDTRLHGDTCVDNTLCHFQYSEYLKRGIKKIGIILNTDPHTKGGSHWISLFIDLEDKFMMFFDSTGHKMQNEVKEFMDRVKGQALKAGHPLQVYDNHTVEHQQGSTECGMYTLFFIITMLKGTTDFHPGKMTKEQRLDLFLRRFEIPDDYMKRYRDIYFD